MCNTCLRNLVLRLYISLSLSLYLTSTTYLNHIFFLLSLPSIPVLNLDLALYLSLVYLSFLSLSSGMIYITDLFPNSLSIILISSGTSFILLVFWICSFSFFPTLHLMVGEGVFLLLVFEMYRPYI